ncbi:MAG: N-methyl-L-tryptophan oxidase, partial [Chitinophagaceae bacterium]
CYHLAKRGVKVLGLEQFDLAHDKGSHAGQSRIIRKAYFEHPDYVPLLELAYKNWRALEEVSGAELYIPTGLLYLGDPEHAVMKGVKTSAAQFGIPIERPNADAYPQIRVSAEQELLFETDAGFVTPERSVLVHVDEAMKLGAEIRTQVEVRSWKVEGGGVVVETRSGSFSADRLVITAGPWTSKLVPLLKPKLEVTRQSVVWVMPEDPEAFQLENFPCWVIAEEGLPGVYYGFPMLPIGRFHNPIGLKLAHHAPATVCDPDQVDRTIYPEDSLPMVEVLHKYFRKGFKQLSAVKTCLYTNTADENFIIDQLPGYENVYVAAGFSGHGFKFAAGIGEIMANLALKDSTQYPVGFLGFKERG